MQHGVAYYHPQVAPPVYAYGPQYHHAYGIPTEHQYAPYMPVPVYVQEPLPEYYEQPSAHVPTCGGRAFFQTKQTHRAPNYESGFQDETYHVEAASSSDSDSDSDYGRRRTHCRRLSDGDTDELRARLAGLDAHYGRRHGEPRAPGFMDSVRSIFTRRPPVPDTFSRATIKEVSDKEAEKIERERRLKQEKLERRLQKERERQARTEARRTTRPDSATCRARSKLADDQFVNIGFGTGMTPNTTIRLTGGQAAQVLGNATVYTAGPARVATVRLPAHVARVYSPDVGYRAPPAAYIHTH